MTTLFSLVSLGFFLGMRHATDADHVIALSTIVTRQRSLGSAVLIGALWGVGHTLTILVVGGAIILWSVVIPPRLGLSMELAVAIMLVVLGLWNLTGFLSLLRGGSGADRHVHGHHHGHLFHSHAHEMGDHGHAEPSPAAAGRLGPAGRLGGFQVFRPLAVGVVHGLAGSAAVALLVLATIRDPWWAFGYLVLFGIGTVMGMMLITTAIAAPLAYGAGRIERLQHHLRVASGLVSLAFGLFLVYEIGFVNGLFTGNARWSPE
ncbi:MAG: high-affinity nickel-transport family protein [Candidatus Rokubacteria bacterium]|nr:high-affinity nickel-transport family protein [Candidatus Rokubacteria bacterium]